MVKMDKVQARRDISWCNTFGFKVVRSIWVHSDAPQELQDDPRGARPRLVAHELN